MSAAGAALSELEAVRGGVRVGETAVAESVVGGLPGFFVAETVFRVVAARAAKHEIEKEIKKFSEESIRVLNPVRAEIRALERQSRHAARHVEHNRLAHAAFYADLQRQISRARRDLRELDPLLSRELNAALRDAVDRAAREASSLAPHRTGRLAASYRPFVAGRRVGVRSRLPYAGVVEFGGTIRPRGVPIVFPRAEPVTRAIDHTADQVVDDMARVVERFAATHLGLR